MASALSTGIVLGLFTVNEHKRLVLLLHELHNSFNLNIIFSQEIYQIDSRFPHS